MNCQRAHYRAPKVETLLEGPLKNCLKKKENRCAARTSLERGTEKRDRLRISCHWGGGSAKLLEKRTIIWKRPSTNSQKNRSLSEKNGETAGFDRKGACRENVAESRVDGQKAVSSHHARWWGKKKKLKECRNHIPSLRHIQGHFYQDCRGKWGLGAAEGGMPNVGNWSPARKALGIGQKTAAKIT